MADTPFCLDVAGIYNGETAEIPFSFRFTPEDIPEMDLHFPEDAAVTGCVREKAHGVGLSESYVELVFTVSAPFETHCARCACDVRRDYAVSRTYGIARKLESDADDLIEVPQGSLLDVSELAESAFFLELPTKVLCRDDCRGLCFRCGADLNRGECGCDRRMRSTPLASLKSLLEKDGDEGKK